MDTKLKNNKGTGILASALALVLLAALTLACTQPMYHQAQTHAEDVYSQGDFTRDLHHYTYLHNWKLQQYLNGSGLSPVDVYFPGAEQSTYNYYADLFGDGNTQSEPEPVSPSLPGPDDLDVSDISDLLEGEINSEPNSGMLEPDDDDSVAASGEGNTLLGGDAGGNGTQTGTGALSEDALNEQHNALLQLNYSCNQAMSNWQDNFDSRWQNYEYTVYSTETGEFYPTAAGNLLTQLAVGGYTEELEEQLQQQYRYYVMFSYSDKGRLSMPFVYGGNRTTLMGTQEYDMAQDMLAYTSDYNYDIYGNIAAPKNAVFVYAIPIVVQGTDVMDHQESMEVTNYFMYSAYWNFELLYGITLVLAALLGLVMVRVKKLELAGLPLARIPFIPSAALVVAAFLWPVGNSLAQLYYTFGNLFSRPSSMIALLLGFALLLIVYSAVYWAAMSLRLIWVLGPKEYLRKYLFVTKFWQWLRKWCHILWAWLTDIDLTDKTNKSIIKILIANFVVLTLFCTIWVFGIIGLIIYSLVLYFVLRRYARRLKKQYGILLNATREMAQGNLNVQIEDNLGIFEPLKQELLTVQEGFYEAVDKEIISQKMKTELVTNVSHDLKTPLTAIITYIGLLKDEKATDEEREKYIETLDKKAQQLKRLIEDLFEMSKASSRDVALNVTPVDLPALIRQVGAEEQDTLERAGIEIRYQLGEEKVVLALDGEKTSRIFHNLFINIAKYAMQGTRAYIDLQRDGNMVCVTMKNISYDALDFDTGEITERFVRGDRSRNTEGSGLGLAIVKSFAEIQGGSFHIQTDGDLFKAVVCFPAGGDVAPPPAADGPQ